jgi:hypothetical protein
LTDTQLVHTLRSLWCADDKPTQITPLDLGQITRLLLQHADERDVFTSQSTLAEQLCATSPSIIRSQERLSTLGWLIIRKGGYRGRTNLYTVALDKLPVANLARTVVSAEAKHLAAQYGNNLRVEHRKKFMRGWLQQWSFQIQKLIDRADGDHAHVCSIINFAFSRTEYATKAMRGPAEIRRMWRKLNTDFRAVTK